MESNQNPEAASYYRVNPDYVAELYALQIELLKLQKFIFEKGLRLAIFFEGRDAAGKGAAINRFTQFLNPKSYRVVALGTPTAEEKGQWYFQRYLKQLPNAGQIIFFDRSWYNRAVVEPVMGFCDQEQYQRFMGQVNQLEKMLVEDGVFLVKFWFSIKMEEQQERIQKRLDSPLMQWKVSPVDLAAREKWQDFTYYKNQMFDKTHTEHCPWVIVRGSEREDSRVQAMRYILSLFEYPGKSEALGPPDEKKIFYFQTYE
ncbi:MAG: polyphosphate kinase 2 [Saprospiraceae bacterium]|nr:polyphosphate kinase 2 [Saprospiraceae bacterium]